MHCCALASTVAREEEAERQFVTHTPAQRRLKGRNDDAAPPGETLRDVMPAFSPDTLCTSKCLAFRDK